MTENIGKTAICMQFRLTIDRVFVCVCANLMTLFIEIQIVIPTLRPSHSFLFGCKQFHLIALSQKSNHLLSECSHH